MYYNVFFSTCKINIELLYTFFYIIYYYIFSLVYDINNENDIDDSIIFYCGYGNIPGEKKKWNGLTKYMGGSENSLIILAESLSLQYNVKVYNNCSKNIKINGVEYINTKYFDYYKKYNTVIFWRFPFPYLFIKMKINNSVLWLHDGEPLCKFLEYIDKSYVNNYFSRVVNNLNVVVSPSKFLRNKITSCFKLNNQISVIPNFVKRKSKKVKEKKNKILWHINFNRGLTTILENWENIKSIDKDFELHIYGNKSELYMNCNIYDNINLDGVYFNKKLSHEDILDIIPEYKYFLYPAIIRESFSISTWECLINNCLPIVYDMGAVNEIIDFGGIVVDKNFNSILMELKMLVNDKYYEKKIKDIKQIDFSFLSKDNIIKNWLEIIESQSFLNTKKEFNQEYEQIFEEIISSYKKYDLNKYSIKNKED